MDFVRTFLARETDLGIRGPRVELKAPREGDFEAWASLRSASYGELQPFEPFWAPDDLTRHSFRRRLRRYEREARDDAGYAFFVHHRTEETLLGGMTLGGIRRGVAQAATLGYWMATQHTGKGYMSEAVMALLAHAFTTLDLHRVEAACLPENRASMRVLEKAGFEREGFARSYLKINGRWQDHLLYARVRTVERNA
ncbi:MAG: GNAT family N-acetyltransferase [Hyphomicrobiaceae bacterium]|nr:GNAT family N-acetyltransferase [Hyphomicrobiaceae bacterium]